MSANLSVSASLVDPIGHSGRRGVQKVLDGLLWLSLLPFIAAALSHPLATGWAGLAIVFGPFSALALARLWATYANTLPGIKNLSLIHI